MQIYNQVLRICLYALFAAFSVILKADLVDEIPTDEKPRVLPGKIPSPRKKILPKAKKVAPKKVMKKKEEDNVLTHGGKVSFGGNLFIGQNQEGYIDIRDKVWVKQGKLELRSDQARIFLDKTSAHIK